MTTQKHTSTPFKIADENDAVYSPETITICDSTGDRSICDIIGGMGIDLDNAAFIVRACNAHDDLVEALEKAIESIDGMKQMLNSAGMAYGLGLTFKLANEALAKAKEEA